MLPLVKDLETQARNGTIFDIATTEDSHYQKHASSSIGDINRVLSKAYKSSSASHFEVDYDDYGTNDIKDIMKIIIGDCLAYNVATSKIHTSSTISIIQLLADASNGEKVNMCLDYGDIVGKGVFYNKKTDELLEFETPYVNIVVRRDFHNPVGFTFVTAYPDITNAEGLTTGAIRPTNRDLRQDVRKTYAYKNSSPDVQLYFEAIASPNCKHYKVNAPGKPFKQYTVLHSSESLVLVMKDRNSILYGDLLNENMFKAFKSDYPNFIKKKDLEIIRNSILNHKQIQKEAKKQKSLRRLQKMRF